MLGAAGSQAVTAATFSTNGKLESDI